MTEQTIKTQQNGSHNGITWTSGTYFNPHVSRNADRFEPEGSGHQLDATGAVQTYRFADVVVAPQTPNYFGRGRPYGRIERRSIPTSVTNGTYYLTAE